MKGTADDDLGLALLPILFFWAIDFLRIVRLRVTLTDGAILVRRMATTRRIASADIHGIDLPRPGNLVIWTADRRGRALTMASLDEAALRTVGEWWLVHRGAGWQPHWAPASGHWYDAAPGSRRLPQPQPAS